MKNKYKDQRGSTGGQRTRSGPIPLVTKLATLFVTLLPVTTSTFTFFLQKDLKKKYDFFSRLLLHVQVPHMLLSLTTLPRNALFR
jgi:hypothetical protein